MTGSTKPTRHIVAMGGGGFSEEPDNPLLDDFILGLTGHARPRLCFVPTASGDSQRYLDNFYAAFPEDRAQTTHLSLFRDVGISDWEPVLLDQHVIYVGGGSTVNMLAIWRAHGIDRMLRAAWEAGVVLAGISAGMVCWFEACLTDSLGGGPAPLLDGLGLLPGSACPHYDAEPERRPAYHRLIAEGALPGGFAADDGAAPHFVGTQLAEVVTSRPEARAYRVHLEGERVIEEPLPARYLGAAAPG